MAILVDRQNVANLNDTASTDQFFQEKEEFSSKFDKYKKMELSLGITLKLTNLFVF